MRIARRKNVFHDGVMLHARKFSRVLERPLSRAHSATCPTIMQHELPVFAISGMKMKINV
jgi:hypothetical protein